MKYTVLVVDDRPENIRYISLLLQEMGLGDKIYSAPNGKIALQLVEQIPPDIILSDWGMPEMNGLELLKALKESPKTQDIPFIMISAVKIEAESMKESFEAGVHDYLKKPFNKLEFMARVTATLKLQDAYLKIKKKNEEIAGQASVISKQHEELKQLNKLKDKILSIVSHDVRSPLATLDGLLQIFNDEEITLTERELKECTATIQLELNKIQSLMDNLLYWAKSQLAKQEAKKSNINPYDIVQESVSLFQDKINSKRLIIESNIQDDEVIYTDENTLSFLIRNLLANAIKFTPERGKISIDMIYTENAFEVAISDTGMGMDRETIDSLFKDRTMNTQIGTAGEQGTGIGLMLCKDLIENAQGSITVESELRKGSCFKFVIPFEKSFQNNS